MRLFLFSTLLVAACTFEGVPVPGDGDGDGPDAGVDPDPAFAMRVNFGWEVEPYQGVELAGLWSPNPNACSFDGYNWIEGDIRGTLDDPLFWGNLFGDDINCEFPVENGPYRVTLHFAEIFRGGQRCGDSDTDRTTSATIEGAPQGIFNVIEMTGGCAINDGTMPASMAYDVTVNDGGINVDLTGAGGNDHVILSAVEILAL